jgi:hypothetical protein
VPTVRLNVAAAQARVDRKDLERWLAQDLVHHLKSGRQRIIPHTELPILKRVPHLLEAGFTDAMAFSVARIMDAKAPQAEHTWYICLTEAVTLAVKLDT